MYDKLRAIIIAYDGTSNGENIYENNEAIRLVVFALRLGNGAVVDTSSMSNDCFKSVASLSVFSNWTFSLSLLPSGTISISSNSNYPLIIVDFVCV